ncbi:PHB depolymerase family esterase [Actinokineospora auranticolor]|uniref:Polyhydroxybutyrate depolymerase n=1 Tax=Actinokineospora auranticolor TaxID=155976 RepID=A0A2S6H1M3_9PSEU|nr:PHB depolymerase family esterase [Actinokineospora auranticolor]PPK71316.1 polyhydroxybutyrate depolymerase [Actinokineospora auranticolor]
MRFAELAVVTAAVAATVVTPQVAGATPPAHNYPVASTGCQLTSTTLTPGVTAPGSVQSGGLTREYLIHLPTTYQPGHQKPLILAFHGRKSDSAEIEAYSKIDDLDAIAVYPRGLPDQDNERAWQGPLYAAPFDDVQFVADLLDHLQQTLCVQPDRIFAAGKSNGGGFVALLACRLPLRIAAFGIVAGAFYPGTRSDCVEQRAPIVEFHGDDDQVIKYNGDDDNHHEVLPSIADWTQTWATRNLCSSTIVSTPLSSEVVRITRDLCPQNRDIVHYKIITGAHTWPGAAPGSSGNGKVTAQIKATDTFWEFFNDHPLVTGP